MSRKFNRPVLSIEDIRQTELRVSSEAQTASRVTRLLLHNFVGEFDASGHSCEALIVITFGSLFTYVV